MTMKVSILFNIEFGIIQSLVMKVQEDEVQKWVDLYIQEVDRISEFYLKMYEEHKADYDVLKMRFTTKIVTASKNLNALNTTKSLIDEDDNKHSFVTQNSENLVTSNTHRVVDTDVLREKS